MNKYIDREALIDWLKRIPLKDLSDGLGLCRVIMEDDFKKAIKEMPKGIIVDAVQMRNAWRDEEIKDYPPYLDYPKPYKPQTNADRIRAMSDEELAQEMIFFCPTDTVFKGTETYEKPHYTGLDGSYYPASEELVAANLEWLKQPAEGE